MGGLYRHEALPYDGREQFASSCASVVREGLEQDERMIVLASGDKLDEFRDAGCGWSTSSATWCRCAPVSAGPRCAS